MEQLQNRENASGAFTSDGCDVIEKRIEEIVTILADTNGGKSNLYDAVTSIIDKALIRIAMERSGNVKSSAAAFLGINRNTLHNKISKLGIEGNGKG